MERHPTERGWAAKLSRPIVLKDGTTVATLADARSFILRQPNHIQERRAWQRATELMIKPPSMAATSKRRPLRLNSRCSLKRATCDHNQARSSKRSPDERSDIRAASRRSRNYQSAQLDKFAHLVDRRMAQWLGMSPDCCRLVC
jgi:hypothetical protein